MSQYLCWNCGLMQGDDGAPMEASKLCPSCREAAIALAHPTTPRMGEEEDQ